MCDNARSQDAMSSTPEIASQRYDASYYTWSTLFRSIVGTANDQEMRGYVHAKSIINEKRDCEKCDEWKDWLMQYSPTIKFLKDHIEKMGGEINNDNVVCRRCDTMSRNGIRKGAASQEMGITLCANHLRDRGSTEDVLAHELVHAYDYMKFKFNKLDLRHMACTEIRANTLSGECRWTREFFKNQQFKFTNHFQDCVRRRATIAVNMHSQCKDDVEAARIVNEVWGSCFTDTRPFDEIYR